MQVRRFEFEVGHPAEAPPGQPPEADPREAMRAAPSGEDDDRGTDESIEEPGYGHGV